MARNKILIVDDSKVMRMMVRDMLNLGSRYELLEAKDGEEALDLIHQEHSHLALILLDWVMPKVGGWEVFQEIQADADLQKVPLVLMSGKVEEVKSKLGEPFEYFEFIAKPFEKQQLKQAVTSAAAKVKAR